MATDTFETGTSHLCSGADGRVCIVPTKRWDIRHVNHQTNLKADVLSQMTRSDHAITVSNKEELHNALTVAGKELLSSKIWLEGQDFRLWIGRITQPLESAPEQLRDAVMNCIVSSLCFELRCLLNMDSVVGKCEWTFMSISPAYYEKQPRITATKADGYGREVKMQWYTVNDSTQTVIIRMPGMLPLQVRIK